jgi:hypothetical protein
MQALLRLPFKSKQRTLSFNEPLPQSVLNIGDKTRANGFAWRGQFSPQLVESLLLAYCPPGSRVLDPFSGSGTTLLEAANLNLPGYAYEINPAAWLLTRVYTLCNASDSVREAALRAINIKTYQLWRLSQEGIEQGMIQLASSDAGIGIIAGALIILMDLFQNKLARPHFEKTLQRLAEAVRDLPFSAEPVSAELADARSLPLPTATIDFVLSSPPYINVFNYHQHYRKSAELLGHDLLVVARSEIGSNRANRGNRFLTVIQYCLDIAMALKEMHRVCKPDARLILVLGHESRVLGVPFLNAQLVTSIVKKSNAFQVVQTQSRWYTNKFGFRIREDLIHLQPRVIDSAHWDSVARTVARAALTEGLETVTDKNQPALLEAIEQVKTTSGTPLFTHHDPTNNVAYAAPRQTESMPRKQERTGGRLGASPNRRGEIPRLDQCS